MCILCKLEFWFCFPFIIWPEYTRRHTGLLAKAVQRNIMWFLIPFFTGYFVICFSDLLFFWKRWCHLGIRHCVFNKEKNSLATNFRCSFVSWGLLLQMGNVICYRILSVSKNAWIATMCAIPKSARFLSKRPCYFSVWSDKECWTVAFLFMRAVKIVFFMVNECLDWH